MPAPVSRLLALFIVAMGCLAVPAQVAAQRLPFSNTFSGADVTALDAETIRGKIAITAVDGDRVTVTGTVTVRIGVVVPDDALDIARRIAANPPIELTDGTLRLRAPSDARDRRAVTVAYEVQLPRTTRLRVDSESGEITVRGARAATTIRTQSARITVADVRSALDVSTGSGAVVIERCAGPITVETSSSAITARDVSGSFDVRTGSGAVTATFAGAVDVVARTGSSAITLRDVTGGLQAESRSGRIQVSGTPASTWELSSGSGALEIGLGSTARTTVDATSGSGSVRTEQIAVEGTASKGRVNGTINGGGAPLRADSRSGSIVIRRAQVRPPS